MSVENLILAVGNRMMGDDGAGPALYDRLQAEPVSGWLAIDGGSSPENVLHQVLALKPARVLVLDAADMGLSPGELRFVDDHAIADMFIMSTHDLPLSFLLERLREEIADVRFLGIQPDVVAFYFPMTPAVEQAVGRLYQHVFDGSLLADVPWLELES